MTESVALPPAADSASSSNQIPGEGEGEEVDIDDGLDAECPDDAPAADVDAISDCLDAKLAAELHAQINNLRPRRK